ncbi:MAG: DsrE/DsrF/DrsH-like family protein [Candidatus Bathyarchaeia archaeon]
MARKRKMVIVISKGTLDMAYPPLILATTGAAMDLDVHLYFTFWGMDLLNKKKVDRLKIASVGNPSLPVPNIIGCIPGVTALVTSMMKRRIEKNWPSIKDMIKKAADSGVKIHACSPTMNAMGVKKEDLIAEVTDIIGASTYIDHALDADITLFI